MRRLLVLTAAAGLVTALGMPAAGAATVPAGGTSAASAARDGWSAWTPVDNSPYTLTACGTKLRVTAPVSTEESRTRPVPGGTAQQLRGRLVTRLVDVRHPWRRAVFDDSGQSLGDNYSISYDNGDYLFRATGNNFLPFSAPPTGTGLPRTALTHGSITLLIHSSGDAKVYDLVDAPKSVSNVCTLLR